MNQKLESWENVFEAFRHRKRGEAYLSMFEWLEKYHKNGISFNSDSEESIVCPFCGERDFDKIGLKHHLEVYCQEYLKTP